MYSKVFFLLAGVAVALAAPDRPRTSYGPPRVSEESSSSFEHFVPSSGSAESFERFRPSSASAESFERFRPSSASAESFERFRPSSASAESFERYSPSSGSDESYESSEAKYAFQWSVEDESTGNDFDHKEARDGDDTQGVYTVQLPDSRLQIVTYVVEGDDGYVADVKYEGEARFPEYSRESYESRESFEYSSGSDESSERRVYGPPKRTYLAPDSNESK